MGIITKLTAGRRCPTRINLEVDGEYVGVISLEIALTHSLKIGVEVAPQELASWLETTADQKLYQKILNFLSYRPRSTWEVATRLNEYGATAKQQQSLLAQLQSAGQLDDLAFARWWISSRAPSRSRSALVYELRAKHLPSSAITAALADLPDESASLAHLLQQKFGAPSTWPNQRARLYRYAQQKGYSYTTVASVYRDLVTTPC